MSDQRSKTKVMIGVYVEEETRDLVKEILSERGITITDFVVAQFYKLLNNKENEILEKLEIRDGRTKKAKAKAREISSHSKPEKPLIKKR